MIESLKQLQRFRVLTSVVRTATLHFYLALFLSCLGIIFRDFLFGLGVFCICALLSAFYNKLIFDKQVNLFWDAACFLDEELNTQEMYITICEYGDDSQNLMLKLLHLRGFEQGKDYLEQDFESNQKQLIQDKLRQCATLMGILLLLLLLSKGHRYFDNQQSSNLNNGTVNAASKQKTSKDGNSSQFSTTKGSQETNAVGDSKSEYDNGESASSKSGKGDSQNSEQKVKQAHEKVKDSGVAKGSLKKAATQNITQSQKQNSSKNPCTNPNGKGTEGGVSSMKPGTKNSNRNLQEVNKTSKTPKKNNNSNDSKTSLKPENLNKKSKFSEKSLQKKSSPKDKYDAKVRGDFLGDGKFEKLEISDQRDIQNTDYKKRQDALQQVLSNPNLPRSYKNMLKRIYSAEKK